MTSSVTVFGMSLATYTLLHVLIFALFVVLAIVAALRFRGEDAA